MKKNMRIRPWEFFTICDNNSEKAWHTICKRNFSPGVAIPGFSSRIQVLYYFNDLWLFTEADDFCVWRNSWHELAFGIKHLTQCIWHNTLKWPDPMLYLG